MNFEKLPICVRDFNTKIIIKLIFFFYDEIYIILLLPSYWRRSSKSSQVPISRCGYCGKTIIGDILFLFNVANRKPHAIPANYNEKREEKLIKFVLELRM